MRAAGFEQAEIVRVHLDEAAGSRSARFETRGVTVRARKPV